MAIQVGSRSFADTGELQRFVVYCATEYDTKRYVEDTFGVEVTDPEYDALVHRLKELKPNVFSGVTTPSTAKTKGKVVIHDPPMTSIAKSDGDDAEKRDIYNKWIADCASRLGTTADKLGIGQSFKHDGIAIRVNYENGKLVSAGLRPRDGIHGTDVTRHMVNIEGVPATLALPLTLSLNGEIECRFGDFEAVNKDMVTAGDDPYANPRAYTIGRLGKDDAQETVGCRLRVAWYGITGFDDWKKYYRTTVERAKWANNPDGLNLQNANGKGYFVHTLRHTKYDEMLTMEQKAKDLLYYTDGVVLMINDLELFEDLGHKGDDPVNDPRGALAWKYQEQTAEATLSRVEWNASRTGRVVPTAIFDVPFVLADTSNSRATCNNYGWMEMMGIGPGAVVICKKGGKIIPNICGVKTSVNDIGAPTNCPTCGSKLVVNTSGSGNKDLLCQNSDCGAKHIQSWIHYFQKTGAKGLGESAMEKILKSGAVKSLADFYDLKESALTGCGFSGREAVLALATIWMVEPVDDTQELRDAIATARTKKLKMQGWIFFAALGIPGAGETAGKVLVKHFLDFDKIRQATVGELLTVAGIGGTTAASIAGWFKDNEKVVSQLLQRVELELPKTGKLTGVNFCLTGDFALGKKHWKQQIEALGGNCQSSLGKTTNYCVHDLSTGTEKETKALKIGVPIITPKDLEKML